MKQLTCEMCGSTDIIKQDGVYVCQACGTKYSIEEARKMMVEGNVDVSGSTIKVDNTASISNYLKMAHNAYSSGNNKEAEEYCNKVIEIDPQNAEAWLLKGISAAWQSTLGNLRMEEFMSSVANAMSNASTEDELNRLADSAYKEFYKLVLSINKLKLDSVVSLPENWQGYIRFPVSYMQWSIVICSVSTVFLIGLFNGNTQGGFYRLFFFVQSAV